MWVKIPFPVTNVFYCTLVIYARTLKIVHFKKQLPKKNKT